MVVELLPVFLYHMCMEGESWDKKGKYRGRSQSNVNRLCKDKIQYEEKASDDKTTLSYYIPSSSVLAVTSHILLKSFSLSRLLTVFTTVTVIMYLVEDLRPVIT